MWNLSGKRNQCNTMISTLERCYRNISWLAVHLKFTVTQLRKKVIMRGETWQKASRSSMEANQIQYWHVFEELISNFHKNYPLYAYFTLSAFLPFIHSWPQGCSWKYKDPKNILINWFTFYLVNSIPFSHYIYGKIG